MSKMFISCAAFGLPLYLSVWVMNCHFQITPHPTPPLDTNLEVGNFSYLEISSSLLSFGENVQVWIFPLPDCPLPLAYKVGHFHILEGWQLVSSCEARCCAADVRCARLIL